MIRTCQIAMIHQRLKDNAKSITLWVGILLALLILLGSFGLADASVQGLGFDLSVPNGESLFSKIILENIRHWGTQFFNLIFTA